MSDIIDEEKPNKKSKIKADPGVPATPVADDPVPTDRELHEWLEELFYGDAQNYPERIEIWATVLKSRRVEKIKLIRKYTYAPPVADEEILKKMPGKLGKPGKGALVHLANRAVQEMQRHCDAFRKPQTYSIYAINMSRDDDAYAEFSRHLKPKALYREDDKDHEDDDDEEKPNAQARMNEQNLSFMKSMFSTFIVAVEGMLDRDDRLVSRLIGRNEAVEGRLDNTHDQLEKALSYREERDERREKTKVWSDATKRGLDIAFQLAPPIIGTIIGDKGATAAATAAGGNGTAFSFERYTLQNFWRSLTQEQQIAIVGLHDQEKQETITPGILSLEQAKLLAVDVPQGNVPLDALDDLMEGGALAITGEQLMAITQVVPMQLLASLKILFDSRTARRQAAATASQ